MGDAKEPTAVGTGMQFLNGNFIIHPSRNDGWRTKPAVMSTYIRTYKIRSVGW